MEIDALDEEIKKIEADLSESDRRKRIRIDKLEADIGKKEGFIKMLSNYLIDYTVLMDGQLGVKTDAILLENNPENYGFLSPEWQQKVF
ncbi:MAG: hypothetical protein LBF15_03985 [Candidatus Peribacteria bacterium]|jgi:hypothetical protein|nr:hypothetical protein [Candidatus Peribacteria bacterium]